jgi:hypothetical protein
MNGDGGRGGGGGIGEQVGFVSEQLSRMWWNLRRWFRAVPKMLSTWGCLSFPKAGYNSYCNWLLHENVCLSFVLYKGGGDDDEALKLREFCFWKETLISFFSFFGLDLVNFACTR